MNYNFPSAMNSSPNPNPSIPEVGYRFHPTNEELVCNYLKPKILGDDVEDLSIMPVVHVCKHEPSELPDKSNIKSKDAGGYVLCKLKKKPDVKTTKVEPNHHMVSISDFEPAPNCSIEGECGPSMEMPSKFINHSTHGYGESSLLDLDFDNPNLDISAPDEGEWNSLTVPPSGLENGNPWEKTEEGCLRPSVVSPENSPTDALLPDLSQLIPHLRAELKALISELENNLRSPFQPAASVSTEEIPFHMGFDAPVST